MEIVVVTGIRKHSDKIDTQVNALVADGYQLLDNVAQNDVHPIDIEADVHKLISFLQNHSSNQKFCMKTNSDHVINALRVLKFKKTVDIFKAIHFGEDGLAKTVICEDDGEMSDYPNGFLDEWPNLMSQLA